MRIFIHSAHAALEYDQARMFSEAGLQVAGRWDLGSTQRPKLAGITDHNSDLSFGDVVLVHQCDNFPRVVAEYEAAGFPVILNAFGQGDEQQTKTIAGLATLNPKIHVVAYSRKDHARFAAFAPADQVHLIRFGKRLDDYGAWVGDWPVLFVAVNAIARRGHGGQACNFWLVNYLADQSFPILMGGIESDFLHNGVGELSDRGLRNVLRHARGAFIPGTIPAPYTLGLVEAACAGTPIIAYDNGHGILNEGFDLPMDDTGSGICRLAEILIGDRQKAVMFHERSLACARANFDVQTVTAEWLDVIRRLS